MKRSPIIILALLALIFSVSASAASYGSFTVGSLDTAFGSVTTTEISKSIEGGTLSTRKWSYPDGSCFSCSRADIKGAIEEPFALEALTVTGKRLEVRYYSEYYEKWKSAIITDETTYSFGMFYIRIDDAKDYIILAPQAYYPHDNQTLKALETGTVTFSPTETGWTISLNAPETYYDRYIDYFILSSPGRIIDWMDAETPELWEGFQLTGDNRWCYNGYYYVCPSNYIPTGDDYYYRLPAAYITCKLIPLGETCKAAKYMAIAMLDTMADLQNDEGYFPTYAGSQWLLEDYSIGSGFYDTRFNTDLIRGFWKAYDLYGIEKFKTITLDYLEFYKAYAENHHQTVKYNGVEGWLVCDYWNSSGGKTTHTSLNHQVAEMCLLEEVFAITEDSSLTELESKLFTGIQATESFWYMSDGNLNYGYLKGKAIGTDYPYLTYNDLYDLDALYYDRLGYNVKVLSRLMSSKLKWMKANGITEYKQ